MTRLSVNINKFATLRNARGGNNPDVLKAASDCERFGAQGITVHPRPDERHIRNSDVIGLTRIVTTEFNIEGYPDERYLKIIQAASPTQATLVPDTVEVITSNSGWDTVKHADFLKPIVEKIKGFGIRVSLFVDPVPKMIAGAAAVGAASETVVTRPSEEPSRKTGNSPMKSSFRSIWFPLWSKYSAKSPGPICTKWPRSQW
jgi:pyridoxine 5-phosphate synthase